MVTKGATRVLVRADASFEVGTGHVMRCLTFADRLAARGAKVVFACCALPGNLLELVARRGFAARALSTSVAGWEEDARQTLAAFEGPSFDWLVVDHYRLDASWERRLRERVSRVMVIDDLANRPHDCDVLLDQNYYDDAAQRYRKFVPATCRQFLGPRYALLLPRFYELRSARNVRAGEVANIFLSFGGADPTNQTAKVLCALEQLIGQTVAPIGVDVLVGLSNPNRADIEQRCRALPWARFHFASERVADLPDIATVAADHQSGWSDGRGCQGDA